MTERLRIWVPGRARAQGSMVAFSSASTGKMVYRGMAKGLGPWRKAIRVTAMEAVAEWETERMARPGEYVRAGGPWPLWDRDAPIRLRLGFMLPRPKVLPRGRSTYYPTVTPDLDKLARAVLDALTGVLYVDDAQVVILRVTKTYPGPEGPGLEVLADKAPQQEDANHEHHHHSGLPGPGGHAELL